MRTINAGDIGKTRRHIEIIPEKELEPSEAPVHEPAIEPTVAPAAEPVPA
jgi:hypothetical protein